MTCPTCQIGVFVQLISFLVQVAVFVQSHRRVEVPWFSALFFTLHAEMLAPGVGVHACDNLAQTPTIVFETVLSRANLRSER